MGQKLKVGILGATGMVGQRFISLLEGHPVQRCALLLDTTGVSVFAYSSSIARISSFVISTALNTKSTQAATASTSLTFMTTSFFTASGIGVAIFQRPPTASS